MTDNTEQPDFSLIIASAVHDMKNSLGMLLHSVDHLCEQLPANLKHELNTATIKYETERVNSYLVQLLGLYRLQNHNLSLHIDEYYLSDLLDEHRAQYQEVLQSKNIELNTETDEALSWYFDRELILGLINNALNNASRYTKSKIDLCAFVDDNQLVIEVHDDGDGYPAFLLAAEPGEIIKNISFSTGSTSLGLYFASMVAKMHKQGEACGSIHLSNGGRLGGGVFTVRLP